MLERGSRQKYMCVDEKEFYANHYRRIFACETEMVVVRKKDCRSGTGRVQDGPEPGQMIRVGNPIWIYYSYY